jgi:hypothetical protein
MPSRWSRPHHQTNENWSLRGQDSCALCVEETAPLGRSGGADRDQTFFKACYPSPILCSIRFSLLTCLLHPLLVRIPRRLSSAAMARRLTTPAALNSSTTAVRSAANAAALADTVARSATAFFPALRRLMAASGLPSFTPRAFATASAFILREIASLGLSDQRHDPDGQVFCLQYVHCHEPHSVVAQGHEERCVTAEPIQLGDH